MVKGELATCMYILYSGKVGIYKDTNCDEENWAVTLKPNRVFGDKALMKRRGTRDASIKAVSEKVKLLKLEQKDFDDILKVFIRTLSLFYH
jgi:CRP-like cAMP-binding protein